MQSVGIVQARGSAISGDSAVQARGVLPVVEARGKGESGGER